MYEEQREELVESLKRRGYLETPRIIQAFEKVPREKFIPSKVKKDAYADHPLSIGKNQTISAPSMIAIMLEVLDLKPGQKILEIGTGSGYNAALLAEITGTEGKVYTIERLENLAKTAQKNLEDTGYENIEILIKDGTKGHEKEAPWDRILVTACAPEIPDPLIEQLKTGGKTAAPVGERYMSQTLLKIEKTTENKRKTTKHGKCAFVPLIGKHGWDNPPYSSR